MEKLLEYIAKETRGKSFKSYKYCFDGIEVPSVIYDDNDNITFKKFGETNSDYQKGSINLEQRVKKFNEQQIPSLFKYFLDGTRRTYKVDDIAYPNNRIYPIVAGQIGVGVTVRENPESFKIKKFEKHLVLSLPDCADKDGKGTLFFNNLVSKINQHETLRNKNIQFNKILSYEDSGDQEKYENKGIATIQDEMIDLEKSIVKELAQKNLLNEDAYLIKDGSLEYAKVNTGNHRELSLLINNYRRVIGVSKSFNPESCHDERGKSNAKRIADLKIYHRTPAYMYEASRVGDVRFAIWYLRIREAFRTASPFDGIIKIQKILVTDDEQKNGLDSTEIDNISANLINERNPVCYGNDNRWANHLYPIYLTERFLKSQYLSDIFFLNIF